MAPAVPAPSPFNLCTTGAESTLQRLDTAGVQVLLTRAESTAVVGNWQRERTTVAEWLSAGLSRADSNFAMPCTNSPQTLECPDDDVGGHGRVCESFDHVGVHLHNKARPVQSWIGTGAHRTPTVCDTRFHMQVLHHSSYTAAPDSLAARAEKPVQLSTA